MADTEALELRVRGRVQGVGFRYYARHTASLIGATGWVRNEPDGSVTIYAEGTADQLRRMEEFAREGAPAATVTGVTVRRVPAQGTFRTFSVDY